MTEKTGDWNRVNSDLKKLNENIGKALETSFWQAGLMIEAQLVLHIDNQDLGWKNKESYTASKIAKNLSENVWIATSVLQQSITTVNVKPGKEVLVGVLRNGGKRKDGASNVLIAAVLEYGSPARGISPKPLFAPTLKEMTPKVEEHIMKSIDKVLKEVG